MPAPDGPLTPMTYSASRITTWMNCQRKAGWIYITGYEDPGNADTDFGTQVHAELEAAKTVPGYLPNRLTEVGAVASEALPYVEDFRPEDGAAPEGEFTLQVGRHKWRGFIDLRKPGHIVDYKTTSDFKWAKTPEQLLYDPQAILYAVKEFSRYDGDTVDLMWLYLRKRAPYAAKAVRVTMTRAHAMRAFEALERRADEMHAAAAGAPADSALRHRYVLDTLPMTESHCSAYRGCPFRDAHCNIPFFSNTDRNAKGSTHMGLLEDLQKMDAALAGGGNPLAPPSRPVPPMMGVPTPFAAGTGIAGVPLAFAPGGGFEGLPPPPPAVVAPDPAGGATTFNPGFLMQPDAPPAPPAPPAPVNDASAPTERQIPVAEVVTPGQINPPKRRGRPPGSKNKTDAAPPAPEGTMHVVSPGVTVYTAPATIPAPPPAPAAAPALSSAPAAPVTPPKHRIDTLYVGCLPRGIAENGPVEIADFDLLVGRAKVAIGPQDYRLFEYGKGNGMLLQMLEAIVQHDKPAAVLVVDPRAPEAILCLSHLRSISDTVVEALR